jgi:hypothetical protein
MLQADIADQGSAVARSVMNDLVARGMMDANVWRMAAIAPPITGIGETANTYSRPVGPAIEAWKQQTGLTPWQLSQRAGNVYILDPLALSVTTIPSGHAQNKLTSPFPAEAYFMNVNTAYGSCTAWSPWSISNPDYWPIRRVTFVQPATATTVRRMDAPLAWSLFSSNSDLVAETQTSDLPATQRIDWRDLNSNKQLDPGEALTRQSIGDFTYLVTIVPPSTAARNALASGTYTCDVSVVVFYKRGIPYRFATSAEAIANATELQARERITKARIVSTGPNGGEVLIEDANTGQANPFQSLRAGQWIMLCGPKPIMATTPTPADAEFTAGWYQVQAIDEDGIGVPSFDPITMRLLTLRGPEWMWQPAANFSDTAALSNNLCVGIFPGAVAVHTKTMRLQSAPR